MIKEQQGIATIAVIAIAFAVGAVFEHFIEVKNHPAEQVVECVLEEYGIDKDFSADKE